MKKMDRFFQSRAKGKELKGKNGCEQPQKAMPLPTRDTDPKYVFAHFVAGCAAGMSAADWASDIAMAKATKIDGFALNVASGDSNTDRIIAQAYAAAEAAGGFTIFFSFDYLGWGEWNADRVISLINQYKVSPAQCIYRGQPLVSTFEGVGNIDDWPRIKKATGCFLMPDWSSLGPKAFSQHLKVADGAFSWDAWPEGNQRKTISSDMNWKEMLGNRPFMMPVSPWFYTNLPQWDKNWLWRSDDLWFSRWQDIVSLQPEMVQIVSWNDFGECHYIGPVHDSGIPQGAHYVKDMPHTAWQKFLPHYIDAYKSGKPISCAKAKDAITYWYKLNPGSCGSSGGTTGNSRGHGQTLMPPQLLSQDAIFFSVLARKPSDVYVSIGDSSPVSLRADNPGINHFSLPLGDRAGSVQIRVCRAGSEVVAVVGPDITACEGGDLINWNAFVGSS